MIEYEDFLKVDVRVGKIIGVEDFPRARKPAYKVKVDFGDKIGLKQSSVQATNYSKEELKNMQVLGVVNLEPRNIAGFMSEVLILGAEGSDGQLSLLKPSKDAKLGAQIY